MTEEAFRRLHKSIDDLTHLAERNLIVGFILGFICGISSSLIGLIIGLKLL